jgi:hypothetical protein
VDVIPLDTLRRLVRDCIEQHIDQRALEMALIAEDQERKTLIS